MLNWIRWDIVTQDFRYAWRSLHKGPGFAATAILTLALAIGASTAVFTVVDSVILKPLAYRDSGSLIVAWERIRFPGGEPTGPNPRHVDLWQKRATAFSGLSYLRRTAMGLTLSAEHPRLVVDPPVILTVTGLFLAAAAAAAFLPARRAASVDPMDALRAD
jgi:ABC-type antimicrobial peptide transport system permease subunit